MGLRYRKCLFLGVLFLFLTETRTIIINRRNRKCRLFLRRRHYKYIIIIRRNRGNHFIVTTNVVSDMAGLS